MRIVDLALRRRVTIAMATVAVTLFGAVSLSRLKVNLLPDLSYPTLTIRTELPGAAPLEVENLIARPIEEAAGTIRNVRSVRSVSRSGQADVVLEFAWGTDMDFAGIEVTRGVKDGESVVTVGQNGLKSGNAVRVVSLETKPTADLRAAFAAKVAADTRTANR